MPKRSELKAAQERYNEAVSRLEEKRQEIMQVVFAKWEGSVCGRLTYDPVTDDLYITDGDKTVDFTGEDGEKLLAALKELYE